MKRAKWLIEAGLIFSLVVPLAILPLRVSLKAGEVLGLLLFYAWRKRRNIAIENLTRTVDVAPLFLRQSIESTIKQVFMNMGRSAAEIAKIYLGCARKIIDSVRIEGIEHFRAARAQGKGILFITGHCGNWELLAIAASVKLAPIAVVARPLDNPYLNRLVERARKSYGNTVLHKKGALKSILRLLKNNGCVGILMDQAVIPEEGFVIDFLGRKAWTTKMPALIARKTGAAVLPAFIRREKRSHTITIHPEVALSEHCDMDSAIKADTQTFSRFIEDFIREHPTEWLWIHRRWKRVNTSTQ